MKKIFHFLFCILFAFCGVACQNIQEDISTHSSTESFHEESSSSEQETGMYVNWYEYYTSFAEFEEFVFSLKAKKDVKILSLRMSDISKTEYTFDGGVINAETKEEIFPDAEYVFSFSLEKEIEPYQNSSYTIMGTSKILSKDAEIVTTDLEVDFVEEKSENMRMYAVKYEGATVMEFSVAWLNASSFSIEEVLAHIQNSFIIL